MVIIFAFVVVTKKSVAFGLEMHACGGSYLGLHFETDVIHYCVSAHDPEKSCFDVLKRMFTRETQIGGKNACRFHDDVTLILRKKY